jgi:hypothetical protein
VLLVPAYAVVVAAPSGPDQGCPSPRQLTEALMAHIPAVVVSADEASTPGVLKLTVTGGGPIPLRVELTDQGGEARLYRSLTVAERSRAPDCPALADTVALIVERFLRDLGYEAPPSPPPPPREPPQDNLTRGPPGPPPGASRLDILAGGAWRGASGSQPTNFEGGLGLGFERGLFGRRVAAIFSGGIASSSAAVGYRDYPAARTTLYRIPVRLGFFLPILMGPGWLEPGLRLAVDWLFVSRTWNATETVSSGSDTFMWASPGGELVMAYRVPLLRRLFARPAVSAGGTLPYDVKAPTKDGLTVFDQPRLYVKAGMELGFSFQ